MEPALRPSEKATHDINDQGNHKDQTKCTAAKDGATKKKAATAKQKQEHK